MKKKFLINLSLLVFLNILIKPFWVFGIDRTVQNLIGLSEYGLLFALFNLSVVFNIFLDFGINNFNNRSISQNPKSIYTNFPNIVVIKLMLAILYAIVTFGAAYFLGYEGRIIKILILLTFNQFLLSYIMFLRSNVIGLQYYITDSILSVADRFFMILACLFAYAIYFHNHLVTIEWFVGIQTISYILSGITITLILFSKHGKIPFSFHWDLSWIIVKQSYPYALLMFLMAAYSRIDSIMLERLLPGGSGQAGIYAQSFRILDSVVMMAILFAGLLLPMFSKMLAQKMNLAPFTRMAFHIIWVISISFTMASVIYAKEIIGFLYKEGGGYSADVFSILISTFIPISIINVYGTLITATGNLRNLNIVACISLLINVALNFILIPHYYAIGAAISSLITQLFVAVAQTIIIHKQFNTVFFKPLRIFLFTLSTLVVAISFHYIIPIWYAGFVAIGILGVLFGMITGLIPYPEWKKFLEANSNNISR